MGDASTVHATADALQRRRSAPPEVDWEKLDKKKFLMLGAAVFSVRCFFFGNRKKTRSIERERKQAAAKKRKTRFFLSFFLFLETLLSLPPS